MQKVTAVCLAILLACTFLTACGGDTNDTQPPQCDHYDMDVDNLCDDCGTAMPSTEQTEPSETQPDYGTVQLCLQVEYTLGAYSSGVTVMKLYEGNVVTVESMVDTSAVGQGEQVIRETGTWEYDQENDTYSLAIANTQYTLRKNDQGVFAVQYSFTMRGQTGGTQDISVNLIQTNIE